MTPGFTRQKRARDQKGANCGSVRPRASRGSGALKGCTPCWGQHWAPKGGAGTRAETQASLSYALCIVLINKTLIYAMPVMNNLPGCRTIRVRSNVQAPRFADRYSWRGNLLPCAE